MTDPAMFTLIVEGEDTSGSETLSVLRPLYAGQPAPETTRCRQGYEDSIEIKEKAAVVVMNWIGGMSGHERIRFSLAMRAE